MSLWFDFWQRPYFLFEFLALAIGMGTWGMIFLFHTHGDIQPKCEDYPGSDSTSNSIALRKISICAELGFSPPSLYLAVAGRGLLTMIPTIAAIQRKFQTGMKQFQVRERIVGLLWKNHDSELSYLCISTRFPAFLPLYIRKQEFLCVFRESRQWHVSVST